MKASEIILTAIDIIEKRGWHQGHLSDGEWHTGPVCLGGAVTVAVSNEQVDYAGWNDLQFKAWTDLRNQHHHLARQALSHHVTSTTHFKGSVEFNDHPDTTQEDVLLALKTTAHELQADGK